MSDTIRHAMDVMSTMKGLKLPPKPSSKNAMERIAQEVEHEEKLDKLAARVQLTCMAAEEGAWKHVEVNMRGVDGNAYNLMGVASSALAGAGASVWERQVFLGKCMSGDYENLLETIQTWVTVVDKPRHDVVRNPFEKGNI